MKAQTEHNCLTVDLTTTKIKKTYIHSP